MIHCILPFLLLSSFIYLLIYFFSVCPLHTKLVHLPTRARKEARFGRIKYEKKNASLKSFRLVREGQCSIKRIAIDARVSSTHLSTNNVVCFCIASLKRAVQKINSTDRFLDIVRLAILELSIPSLVRWQISERSLGIFVPDTRDSSADASSEIRPRFG